jgi:cellulose synthase/poly-beta-1,6-N-acetylglucosamine synthase-like glycosyltransferase
LRETAPDAEIVGVVDADYLVSPDWLSSLVGYFEEERVGFVQAPQDHRDWSRHPFGEMINWEYAGFFHIGMIHRNERNAIIQHGTMTLIRRSALERLGGWAEWCICEDAELGLRLLDAGYSSVYVNHPFGRGVVPDSFAGYTRQRFRWVFGAGQILRRHKKKLLFGINTRLTAAQRYHFVAGWMPWLTDLLHVVFTAAGLIWSLGLIVFPKRFDYPLSLFVIPALTLFGLKVFASLWLYTRRVPCTLRQRIGAAIAALALSFTVARGVLAGLFFRSLPFHRTPKRARAPALIEGVRMASSETILTLMIAAAAAGLIYSGALATIDGLLWVLMLGALSLPYVAAVILAVTAALPARAVAVDERPAAMAAE